jgi:hypothetical protein
MVVFIPMMKISYLVCLKESPRNRIRQNFGFSDSKKEFGLAFFREPVKRERDQVNHTATIISTILNTSLTLTLSLTLYQHVASTVLA